jgi:hypothetical protein
MILRDSFLVSGTPQSVGEVTQGKDFLYRDGMLCCLSGTKVSITNTHAPQHPPLSFDLSAVYMETTDNIRFRLLHYQCNLLTIKARARKAQRFRILVFDICHGNKPSCILTNDIQVSNCRHAIVRNNRNHIVIGFLSSIPVEEAGRWLFAKYELNSDSGNWICETDSFDELDIGSTIVIEVIGHHFWIATSEITGNVHQQNSTSYYGGLCCDLAAKTDLRFWRTFRRNHKDSSIDERWSRLRLDTDEHGCYRITETRVEMPDNSCKSRKFCVTQIDPTYLRGNELHAGIQTLTMPSSIRMSSPESEESIEGDSLGLFQNLSEIYFDDLSPCHLSSYTDNLFEEFPKQNLLYHYFDPRIATSLDLVLHTEGSSHLSDKRISSDSDAIQLRIYRPHLNDVKVTKLPSVFTPANTKFLRVSDDERSIVFGTCKSRNSPIILLSFDPRTAPKLQLEKLRCQGDLQSSQSGAGGSQCRLAENMLLYCHYFCNMELKAS